MRDIGRSTRTLRATRAVDGDRRGSATGVDVHLGTVTPGRSRLPARTPATSSSPTTAATSGAGSTPPDAYRSRAPSRPGEPLRTPTTVTSLSTTRRLSTGLGCPERPIQTTRPPGSTRSIASAGSSTALDASTTPSNVPAGSASGRHTCSNPSDRANRTVPSRRATRWTSAPRARAIRATRSPIAPAPSTSSRPPAATPAASTARHALPPGSTRAPLASSTRSGRPCSELAGTASCSARAPAHPCRIPTS